MPFEEVKVNHGFIRIKKNGNVTISSSLISYFTKPDNTLFKIRVFNDKENGLVGLRPDNEGYTITVNNNNRRFKSSLLARIIIGEFYPKWDSDEKMLIFNYRNV
jgi:hypothetical protein